MRFEIEAVLFDIDGTLVDSTGVVERAWRTWAAHYGLDAEAVLAVCHGRRSADTVADFLPPEQRVAATERLLRLEQGDFDGVVALPGTAELLSRLPAARWAAVTSGARILMRDRLDAAGLPIPGVLIAAEDVREGKPDPQGYLLAAEALSVDVEHCLVIEDSPAGIAAGRAAGAAVLAVATSHPADELRAADAVVADLTSCSVAPRPSGIEVVAGSPLPPA